MNPLNQYHNNQDIYKQIQENLESLRNKFERSDKQTQRQLLLTSHKFAVLSIQTPVDIHESAFKELEGLGQPSNKLQKVNYWKSKMEWINDAASKTNVLNSVINELQADNIDKAHRILIDKIKGLGAKKAAFTLAMLGYTGKMCIDTNVAQIAGLEEEYTGVVVDKYEKQCKAVREQFSDLSKELPPFMVQWVLFDTQREELSTHQVYFDAVNKYLP